MGPIVTNDIHLSLDFGINEVKVKKLRTYGEEARERFIRVSNRYGIDPHLFRIEVEVRVSGATAGMTDTYYYGEGKRFRSVKEILRFTDQDIEKRLTSESSKINETIKIALDLCEPFVVKSEIEPDIFPFNENLNVVTYIDSRGHSRRMCKNPYNTNVRHYKQLGWDHTSECKCPHHRKFTYWRRLSSKVHGDRQSFIKSKNEHYMQTVVGMSHDKYLEFLHERYRCMFSGLVPESEFQKTPLELFDSDLVIDEFYPRCAGKGLTDPSEIATFLAKVFNYANTQYLLRNGTHARKLGVAPEMNKMLVNNRKGGTICEEARRNFDMIVPAPEAVDYFRSVVEDFGF